jgi:polysaccharide export outer membrane protein
MKAMLLSRSLGGFLVLLLGGLAHAQEPGQAPAPSASHELDDYTVSRQDVLSITVIDRPELSAKYTVEVDGALQFPLLGRVPAAGKTLRQIETDLKRTLADGFFKNPQVAVSLDQFKGRRVFVFGGVTLPGTYPLAEGMTLIEALVKAGYGNGSEAVIVRSKDATGPILPDRAGAADVIRVNLREFEKEVEQGQMSRNILLQDGDTIFVPRVDRNRIFVTGQVKAPGAYSVPEGTTVLQAISLAGGLTEGASTGRMRITRIVNGEKKSLKIKLEDLVQPGDTIFVPERYF